MTRLRAICTAVALVCASGQVFADAASHAASAETFLKLAHADKLGTPVYMQVQQMFAQRFEQTKAPASKKALLETYQAKANTRTIEGLAALRPSVEAGFHSILDTYVAHSHSVYANLCTCSKELPEIAKKALEGADYSWGWVSYVDPGARLTFSIRDELRRVEAETGRRPAAIFMQNHGLIAHADDPDECIRIHADVNDRIARAFGLENGCFPKVEIRELGDGLCEAVCPYLSEQLATGDFSEKFMLESPLYPDQLVFLTGSFSFGEGEPEEGMAVANPKTGRVTFRMSAAKAQVIAETLTAIVFIVRNIAQNGYTLSTLGEAAKQFIANWESEKYRKSMAGK